MALAKPAVIINIGLNVDENYLCALYDLIPQAYR